MSDSLYRNKKSQINQRPEYAVSDLRPQFELDAVEARNYQDILRRQADDKPFSYIRRSDTESTILRVNHLRASAEEAIKFKEFMMINIHQGHRQFIIDLSTCEFMDSTFLGAIIMVTKKLRLENGTLSLVADPQKIKVLYALKELDKILKVFKTIDEAVNEIKE